MDDRPLSPAAATVALAADVAAPLAGLPAERAVATSVAIHFPPVTVAALDLLAAELPAVDARSVGGWH